MSSSVRSPNPKTVQERAALSHGASGRAVHDLVARILEDREAGRGALVDVGCGAGNLARRLAGRFERYVGCDAVRYDGFPAEPWATFVEANLDRLPLPLADASGDVVVAVETIEHLENPRAFVRELVRIARPGALIAITTPNQLSWLSTLTFVLRGEFNAFQEGPGLYPSHITALLEVDLRRIARECGLVEVETRYSDVGRIPGTGLHWPARLGFRGRRFSDNVALSGRRSNT